MGRSCRDVLIASAEGYSRRGAPTSAEWLAMTSFRPITGTEAAVYAASDFTTYCLR